MHEHSGVHNFFTRWDLQKRISGMESCILDGFNDISVAKIPEMDFVLKIVNFDIIFSDYCRVV